MATNLTRTTKTFDRGTDTYSVSTATIEGVATRVRGDPIRYRQLELIESEAPTLLWVPKTYGQTPALDDTLTWGSAVYTVADVLPLAPDGVTIQARIIIKR